MITQTQYVAGFMFDPDMKTVLLIRKSRPWWQEGALNGVGGHKNKNETFEAAMVREFREETGIITSERDWEPVLTYLGADFLVMFFHAKSGKIWQAKALTDEPPVLAMVSELYSQVIVQNLLWIIPMLADPYVGFPLHIGEDAGFNQSGSNERRIHHGSS